MSSVLGCDNCGSTDLRIQEWWADDALWLHVVGRYDGMLCAPCFDIMAKRKGWFLRWKPEQYPGIAPPNLDSQSEHTTHDEFLRAFGRGMVAKAAAAEDQVVILRREREAALAEVIRLMRIVSGGGGAL